MDVKAKNKIILVQAGGEKKNSKSLLLLLLSIFCIYYDGAFICLNKI